MKISIFALAIGAGLFAAVPAFAATRQFSTEVDNTITTGDISIVLEEFELDHTGNLIPYQDGKTVLPGQKVTKIISITNEAEPAWIRAKAEFMSRSGIKDISDDMLGGISSQWIKHGDYYYYTEPVSAGEAVRFFEAVTIPADWDERVSEKGFSVDITAQAIQKAHFDPAFSSQNPWFGVPVETCIHTDHELYQAGEDTEFAVIFENGVDGFIRIGNDFFQNFSAMMPGDSITDSFLIGNHFSKALTIQFRTEVPDGQPDDALQLLSDLILTISEGSRVIYTGPLQADALKNGIILADSLKDMETTSVTYSVSMPKELQNASAMQHAKIRWIFSTQYSVPAGGGNSGGRPSGPNDGKPGRRGEPDAVPAESGELVLAAKNLVPLVGKIRQVVYSIFPKTGDREVETGLLCAVMTIGGMVMSLLLIYRFRDRQPAKEGTDEE